MIEIKNLSKYYSANGITNLGLRNINLTLNRNEIIAITGDSGGGKSTLLNVITKLDTFDEGEIYYKGNETSYFSILDMDDFRKNKVGMIFQNYNIIDSYTVLENVMVPLLLLGKTNKEAKEKALELINRVGLSGKEKNRGTKLSGGEKQRCVIARALASDCEILACDEPTGNLDSKTGKEIIELIKEVAKDKLVLIVTHDYSIVKDIVTRKIRISDGEVVEDVVFQPKDPEPNKELDLDYKPLSRKVDFKMARNNIIFTPKKTFFLACILFVISISVLFLFQLIHSSNESLTVTNNYQNQQTNRLYVYSENKQPLDLDKIKSVTDEYESNPFYEEQTFYLANEEFSFYESGLYNSHVNFDLQGGRLPSEKDEIIIIVPEKSRVLGELKRLLNEKIFIRQNNVSNISSIIPKLVGYATSKEIKTLTYMGTQEYSSQIKTFFNIKLSYNGKTLSTNQINYAQKDVAFTLMLPSSEIGKDHSIILTLSDIYTTDKITVEYSENIFYPTLVVSNNNATDLIDVFEASVYSNNPKATKSKLENLGFKVDYPAKLDAEFTIEAFFSNLFSYALMVLASVMLVIVFYITYFILAKVYISKKKDYDILRTLGVTKRDMKKIVTYEIMCIGISAILVAFIVGTICVSTIPKLMFLKNITLMTTLLYFAILILFTFAVGRRFNRKLFKFSVARSLKGDDFFD